MAVVEKIETIQCLRTRSQESESGITLKGKNKVELTINNKTYITREDLIIKWGHVVSNLGLGGSHHDSNDVYKDT